MPMNSVMMMRKFTIKIEKIDRLPQYLPKRSRISRPWPTPVTAPSRATISWMTMRTGISSGKVHSKRVAEVLSGLGVGGDAAGVVVANHDDQSGTDDRDQREKTRANAAAAIVVVLADRAEGSGDLCFFRLLALHVPSPFVSWWSLGETTTQRPKGLEALLSRQAKLCRYVNGLAAGTRGFQKDPLRTRP